MTLQQEVEANTGKIPVRCVYCNGLIKKSPKQAGGYEWRHTFQEDALRCPGAMPDMRSNNEN